MPGTPAEVWQLSNPEAPMRIEAVKMTALTLSESEFGASNEFGAKCLEREVQNVEKIC